MKVLALSRERGTRRCCSMLRPARSFRRTVTPGAMRNATSSPEPDYAAAVWPPAISVHADAETEHGELWTKKGAA